MNKEDLIRLKKKISELSELDKKHRDLYLRKTALGEIQGPSTGYASIDKPWLKYYNDRDIIQDIPAISVYDYLFINNQNNLEKTALNYFGVKISYSKLFKNIDKVKKSLSQLGVKKGDIVTLAMANTPEMVYLFYALNRLGAICNVIDPRYSSTEMKREINEVGSKLFISLDICYPVVSSILSETTIEKIVCISPIESLPLPIRLASKIGKKAKLDNKAINWEEFIKLGEKNIEIIDIGYEKNTPAALVHTGGTTGTPKGVILTNENFVAMANMHKYGGLHYTKNDNFLNILPPFIAYCLCNGINMPLTLGLEVILIPKFDAPDFPELLDKYKPNHVLSGPILWEYVLKSDIKDLSYLKTPVSGGDSLNIEMEKRINNFFKEHGCKVKLAQGYGMTEVSSAAVFSTEKCNKLGSVGIPFIKNVVSIFDPETLIEKNYEEEGEIWISTPTKMLKYYNNEEATSDIMTKTEDEIKWIRTGDIGKISNDGNVYIVGRMKRMIVRNGNKIFPTNVENLLLQIPQIENCAIVGVDDEIERKVPVVHVILKNQNEIDEREICNMIKKLISENLPEFNIPTKYIFRDEMPLTGINKIDFRKLEEEELQEGEILNYSSGKQKLKKK